MKDGKRIDKMTLVPWNKGQSLICVDTFAASYIEKTSVKAESAAKTSNKKTSKLVKISGDKRCINLKQRI